MLYLLEQGPTERKIMELCLRDRRPLPKAIQNAPDLWLGLPIFLGAYLDLESCRQTGWGPGRIPWTAVDRWAHRNRIRGSQFDDLAYYIRAMDTAYLEYCERKSKAKGKK